MLSRGRPTDLDIATPGLPQPPATQRTNPADRLRCAKSNNRSPAAVQAPNVMRL